MQCRVQHSQHLPANMKQVMTLATLLGLGDHLGAEEVRQALHGCSEVAAPAAPPRSLPVSKAPAAFMA